MDLSKYDTPKFAEDGAVLEIVGPDGDLLKTEDGQPVTITVVGADSDTYATASHRIAKGRRSFKFSRGGISVDPKQAEIDVIEILASCTKGWSGIEYHGPFPFSKANARRIYTELPWLREQVHDFIHDRQRFLGE